MCTLYWQINDTWPVHSWSSLDYGAQWKPLHYMARCFFNPVRLVAFPIIDNVRLNSRGSPVEGHAPDSIDIRAVNDTPDVAKFIYKVLAVDMGGVTPTLCGGQSVLGTDAATLLDRVALKDFAVDEFLFLSWTDEDGKIMGETDFFARAYMYYDLPEAQVSVTWLRMDGQPVLRPSADAPAFFVTVSTRVPGYFSDNAITLLPGRETELVFSPRLGAMPHQKEPADGLTAQHLAQGHCQKDLS